ncbi:restriction endonuclease subunit S [Microcystis aeruginosa]|uniref:Type I restriction modification DNA specificity domain-containing protein n=1 Tax=Microcystis aeruginosa PCC 9808 TaxID=1160284 RepID=I4HVB8_MICAE|nr:restriction endonuclease subunit S [Microcystis aeruginosa]CCI25992.1 hypothetical protein MICAG_2980010 [Microcystis aeruginosa PCC 9808]
MARVSTRSFLFFRLSPVRVNSSIAFAIEQGKTGKSFGVLSAKFETFERPLLTSKAKFPIRDLSQLVSEDLLNGIFKKKDFYGEGTLLVNVWDLYRDEVILQKTLERIKTTSEENNRFEAKEGDVFFCRSSLKPEGVGWSCLLERLNEPAVFECHLIRARVNSKEILPSFLNYFARSYFGVSYIRAKSVVTTMATIDQGTLYNLPVICPPVEKQIELVAAMDEARSHRKQKLAESDQLISSIDAEILKILQINQTINIPERKYFSVSNSSIKNSRFDAFFFQPHLISADLLIRNYKSGITELSEILSMEPINGIDSRKYVAFGERYLRVKNIKPFEIKTDDIVYVENNLSVKQRKINLLENDILITRKGSFGICTKVDKSVTDCLISSEIILLRISKTSPYEVDFLVAWLNSSIIQSILNRHKSGAIMGHLTQDVIKQLPVPNISKNLQHQIISEVKHRRSEAQRLRSEAETGWQIAKQWFEDQLLGGS